MPIGMVIWRKVRLSLQKMMVWDRRRRYMFSTRLSMKSSPNRILIVEVGRSRRRGPACSPRHARTWIGLPSHRLPAAAAIPSRGKARGTPVTAVVVG